MPFPDGYTRVELDGVPVQVTLEVTGLVQIGYVPNLAHVTGPDGRGWGFWAEHIPYGGEHGPDPGNPGYTYVYGTPPDGSADVTLETHNTDSNDLGSQHAVDHVATGVYVFRRDSDSTYWFVAGADTVIDSNDITYYWLTGTGTPGTGYSLAGPMKLGGTQMSQYGEDPLVEGWRIFGPQCPTGVPTCDFGVVLSGSQATFTDRSSGWGPTAVYSWDFDGGTLISSGDGVWVVSYPSGTFDPTLTICGPAQVRIPAEITGDGAILENSGVYHPTTMEEAVEGQAPIIAHYLTHEEEITMPSGATGIMIRPTFHIRPSGSRGMM